MADQCNTCQHWALCHLTYEELTFGHCRRYPPFTQHAKRFEIDKLLLDHPSCWPVTRHDWICGEWEKVK